MKETKSEGKEGERSTRENREVFCGDQRGVQVVSCKWSNLGSTFWNIESVWSSSKTVATIASDNGLQFPSYEYQRSKRSRDFELCERRLFRSQEASLFGVTRWRWHRLNKPGKPESMYANGEFDFIGNLPSILYFACLPRLTRQTLLFSLSQQCFSFRLDLSL